MSKKKNTKKIIITIIPILIIAVAYKSWDLYNDIWRANVVLANDMDYLYIKSNSTFEDVANQLVDKKMIKNKNSFEWVAKRKHYTNHVHPGKYKIKSGMSNNDLLNLLRSGKQEPVNVVFNNIRTKNDLAEAISKQIEVNKTEFLTFLNDNKFMAKYKLNSENALTLFIPNTYQMVWNTNAEKFIERISKEYDKFWDNEKRKQADKVGLTLPEISILASIVEQESNKNDEKPTIAGVYINRLRKDMLLEADPTLKFAANDFTIKRLLNKHKQIDSPYNTYMYKGLPPGPICLPSIPSIKAVLNYQNHSYIYFCAKEDFSGYHNFAKTYEQHLVNAKKYQKKLDESHI